MTLEERVTALEKQYKSISKSVLQSQKNQTDTTSKADQANNDVKAITPYTETKTAYISDTECIFNNVPEGNLSVYVKDSEGNYPNYTIERISDKITISFSPLEYVTTITISIQ